MSQENVELLYRAEEAFNRRDLDAFLALLDPNVEFNSRIVELEGGGEPFSQRFTGTFPGQQGDRRLMGDRGGR